MPNLPLKRLLPKIVFLLFLMAAFWLASSSSFLTAGSSLVRIKAELPVVIIDAGHGGADPGKVGTAGTLEKDVNLMIARHLQRILETRDVEVVMTREEDAELGESMDGRKLADMKARIQLINETKPAIVVSIHQNSYTTPDIIGAQCFYYTGSGEAEQLASLIQAQIIDSTGQTKIREIKANSDYYLLKHSPYPTVIVECGFLSNPAEEQLLLDETYQRSMAWAIHLGVLQYLEGVGEE